MLDIPNWKEKAGPGQLFYIYLARQALGTVGISLLFLFQPAELDLRIGSQEDEF